MSELLKKQNYGVEVEFTGTEMENNERQFHYSSTQNRK